MSDSNRRDFLKATAGVAAGTAQAWNVVRPKAREVAPCSWKVATSGNTLMRRRDTAIARPLPVCSTPSAAV